MFQIQTCLQLFQYSNEKSVTHYVHQNFNYIQCLLFCFLPRKWLWNAQEWITLWRALSWYSRGKCLSILSPTTSHQVIRHLDGDEYESNVFFVNFRWVKSLKPLLLYPLPPSTMSLVMLMVVVVLFCWCWWEIVTAMMMMLITMVIRKSWCDNKKKMIYFVPQVLFYIWSVLCTNLRYSCVFVF